MYLGRAELPPLRRAQGYGRGKSLAVSRILRCGAKPPACWWETSPEARRMGLRQASEALRKGCGRTLRMLTAFSRLSLSLLYWCLHGALLTRSISSAGGARQSPIKFDRSEPLLPCPMLAEYHAMYSSDVSPSRISRLARPLPTEPVVLVWQYHFSPR